MNGWAWVRVGAILGFLGVSVGAFGAHGLKARLDELGTATTFHTGVEYHFYHALAVLALGLAWDRLGGKGAANLAGWAFLAGVLIFSGSLYVLAVTGFKKLGMITPIGGVAFLVGWVALGLSAVPGDDRTAAGGDSKPAVTADGGRTVLETESSRPR